MTFSGSAGSCHCLLYGSDAVFGETPPRGGPGHRGVLGRAVGDLGDANVGIATDSRARVAAHAQALRARARRKTEWISTCKMKNRINRGYSRLLCFL